MSALSVARRYAAALFDVTRKAGTAEGAGEDLTAFATAIENHAELNRALTSPAIPVSAKRAVIAALLEKSGIRSAEVKRLVTMLADRDRIASLPDVRAAFTERLMEAQKTVRADVVTATPLDAANRAALASALGRATGKTITLVERVDPSIVGGVVARVGSVVYDGSITRQLEKLRAQLTTNN